jgi:hypothetical protein
MNLSFSGVKEKDSIKRATDKEDIEGTSTRVNTHREASFLRDRVGRRKILKSHRIFVNWELT